MRPISVLLVIVLQLFLSCPSTSAASFDPTTVKISVDEPLWESYHIANPNSVSGDVEKIYKIKKIEVRLLAGDREFGFYTFTPEDKKTQKVSLLHGVASTLTIRIKAYAAENVIWVSSYPFKYVGDDVVIKALPTSVTINYPGI